MKQQQQEKILAFKAKTVKKNIKYSNQWLKKKETHKDKIIKKLSTLLTVPVKKIRGFVNGLDYPAIEIRSMYALERSQSVKDWLKYHNPENKLNNVTERRLSITKIKDKRRKS